MYINFYLLCKLLTPRSLYLRSKQNLVIFLSLALARYEKNKNEELIIKMALVHDLPETRTIDLSYMQKIYIKADELKAMKDTFKNTILEDLIDVWKKYEKRDCIESKIVKDADNLDVELGLKEYDNQGHKLPKKWSKTSRKIVRIKLYTKSAKTLWDEIQISDPDSWHLLSNKYYKFKNPAK